MLSSKPSQLVMSTLPRLARIPLLTSQMPKTANHHHTLHGGCHCGNLRVSLAWPDPGPGPALPVRACCCSFCTKHGAAWTSNPHGRFRLQVADPAKERRYRMGHSTADFHVCVTCGVVPIATCVMEGRRYAVVNGNALADGGPRKLERTDFLAETVGERLARRFRNWTPEADDSAKDDM